MKMSRPALAVLLAGTGLVLLVPTEALAHPCDHPETKAYVLFGCARKKAKAVRAEGHVAISVGGAAIGGGFVVEAEPAPPLPRVVIIAVDPPTPAPEPEPVYVAEPMPEPEPPRAHCCMAPREPAWGAEVAPPAPPPVPVVVAAPPRESWWRREPRYGLGVHGTYGGMVGDARAVSGGGFSIRLRPVRVLQLELSADWLGALKDGDKRVDVLPMASVVVRSFPKWPIGVYGLAGAGASLVGIGGRWDAAPAVQLGGGVELRLGRRFAISADVRWVRAFNGGSSPVVVEAACETRPDDPRCDVGTDSSDTGTDRVAFTLGAAFYF